MNRSPDRWAAAVLLLVVSGTHVPLIHEHLEEAPYIGVLFILLSVVGVLLAVAIVMHETPSVWVAGGVVCLAALLAFLASRTIGLPQIGDDVGNWTEPLGYPAVAAELSMVVLASIHLSHRHTASAPAHLDRRSTS